MADNDKTIRYSIDDKGVSEGNDRIRKSFEDTQRRLVDAARENKRLNKDELEDINKKIKLLDDLYKREEQNSRRKIEDMRIGTVAYGVDTEMWKRRRSETESSLPIKERRKFREETEREYNRRKGIEGDEKMVYLDEKRKYQETRDNNRNQIKELKGLSETVKITSDKGIRSNERGFNDLSRGLMPLMSGNLGGILGAVGGLAGGAMVGAMLVNMTKEYQDSMRNFAVTTQIPMKISNMLMPAFRESRLGMSGIEMADKSAAFSLALSSGVIMNDQLRGLVGAQLSRGFTDEQIKQLLSIQRYTGASTLGTVNNFEEFVKRIDKGSLMKLPEIMDQYLRTANGILQRTGRLDPQALQQTMMSISGSYGVTGLNLERMTSGITGLSSYSNNGVMNSIKMETLRGLHPNMSVWDMYGIMEDPTRDPKYQQALIGRLKNFGGGGDWTKFFLKAQSDMSYKDINTLVEGDYKVAKKVTQDSDQKQLNDKYYTSAQDFVGSIDKLESAIGVLKDQTVQNITYLTNFISDLFMPGRPYENVVSNAVKQGTSQALKENR